MKTKSRFFSKALLGGGLLLLLIFRACRTPPPGPPAFAQAVVTLVPLQTGGGPRNFDLLTLPNGTSVAAIPPDNAIHIIATAIGSPVVTSVTMSGTITWRCRSRQTNGTHVIGVVNTEPLAVTITNPTASASSLDISIKPLTQIVQTCGGIPATQSAVAISIDLRIVATNAEGTTTTNTIILDYLDMP